MDFKDEFNDLPPLQQLKIICAGSWHNVVISVGCFLLASSLPFLLLPFYGPSDGVIVTATLQVGKRVAQLVMILSREDH